MKITRRRVLKTAVATAGATTLSLGRFNRAYGANEKIRMAVIGLHGRGGAHLRGFRQQLVAVCDCDEQVLHRAAESLGTAGDDGRDPVKVDTEQDFRRILDRKDIDAVSIATPNHTHSLIAILAAQSGKDVYIEKPVSHNVWEGQQLVRAARKYDRIVQCGTQGRSSTALQQAVEFVQSGGLGKLQYVVGTCYKPRKSIGRLDQPLQIPKTIDYDLWCGPAAKVPLYRKRLHYDWHFDSNTGNGDMGNQGVHQMDVARWFLGESTLAPLVISVGGRLGYKDAGDTPNTQVVLHGYEKAPLIFETRGLPHSKAAQKTWRPMDNHRGSVIGVLVQCEQGYILASNNHSKCDAFDLDGNRIKTWTVNVQGSKDDPHFENFLQAVRTRRRDDLNAEVLEGHLSSALCHTGNISHQLGNKENAQTIAGQLQSHELFSKSFEQMAAHLDRNEVDIEAEAITFGAQLEMDITTDRFTNNEAANGLLTRDYRHPYVIPDLSQHLAG